MKLFESGVKVIPNNVKLRSNYGLELKEKGRADEAKQQYEVRMSEKYLQLQQLKGAFFLCNAGNT